MAYSDFDLRTARERLGLTLREDVDLFAATPEVAVTERLREFLDEWSPAALAMNTEKARSEMIIAPILMEAVRLSAHRLNLFSGITFDVDKDRGLSGVCDYLLARSPERFFLSHPVVAVVEAKREDIPSGLGQCVAAMVGARTFNERAGVAAAPVYGAVTTGNNWRFAKLEGDVVFIDRPEYYLPQVGKILGILGAMAT
ncbi:MAG TPA: hypothetical protein VEL76_25970 [Gemmataceae bacterium]|nr:hypothetical protein [Gemmataceae bacterium]